MRPAVFSAAPLLIATLLHAQQATRSDLTPVDAIAGIVQAFESNDIIALPEAHGSAQSHAFRLALIRDSRFVNRVDDIVAELGNSRYQDLADRYVRGEQVPVERLRLIWEDTTVSTAGNSYAVMAGLLTAVRTINRTRKDGRTLRVVLGDPPIDWSQVQSRADHQQYLRLRDSHPAALLVTEVIARRRKALLHYGQLHFQRRNIQSNYEMTSSLAQTIVSLAEAATGARVFTIWEVDPGMVPAEMHSWPSPRLAPVAGSAFGARDFADLVGSVMASQRFSVNGNVIAPVPPDAFRRVAVEEQVDAVLYLGRQSAATPSHQIPPDLCRRPGFVTEQIRRIRLSAPPPEADRLRDHCAAIGDP